MNETMEEELNLFNRLTENQSAMKTVTDICSDHLIDAPITPCDGG